MGVALPPPCWPWELSASFFGTGAVFGVPIFQGVIDPIIVFILPPGGFFVFGMLIALANKLSGSKKSRRRSAAPPAP